jgi:hypothetical protein
MMAAFNYVPSVLSAQRIQPPLRYAKKDTQPVASVSSAERAQARCRKAGEFAEWWHRRLSELGYLGSARQDTSRGPVLLNTFTGPRLIKAARQDFWRVVCRYVTTARYL